MQPSRRTSLPATSSTARRPSDRSRACRSRMSMELEAKRPLRRLLLTQGMWARSLISPLLAAQAGATTSPVTRSRTCSTRPTRSRRAPRATAASGSATATRPSTSRTRPTTCAVRRRRGAPAVCSSAAASCHGSRRLLFCQHQRHLVVARAAGIDRLQAAGRPDSCDHVCST